MNRPPLPAAFLRREANRWDVGSLEALAAALDRPPDIGLRAHPRIAGAVDLAARRGWPAVPVPWCPEGVSLERPSAGAHAAAGHPWHDAGAYYLQDPSAMGVVPVLDPQPGEFVLDLAAAPGGKTTHIAGRLGETGLLWAHDAVPARAERLVRNLERWGAANAVVSRGEPQRLRRLANRFDRVLVDAPCSGEGMFRKSDAARVRWSADRVRACAMTQVGLLDLAADLLRPGGTLVYATCTFSREENEGAVEALLDRRPDLALEDLDHARLRPVGTQPGDGPVAVASARWWPHLGPGEGHFVARLRRSDLVGPTAPRSVAPPPAHPTSGLRVADAAQLAAWRAFAADVVGVEVLPEHGVARDGDRLWAVPAAAWDLPLAGSRAGVPLGRVAVDRAGRRRFEPHHALSRVLPRLGEDGARVDLGDGDPAAGIYLRGEPLSAVGLEGWGVVRVDGVPLGWVKAHRGTANNHYPRGLRRDPDRPPASDDDG